MGLAVEAAAADFAQDCQQSLRFPRIRPAGAFVVAELLGGIQPQNTVAAVYALLTLTYVASGRLVGGARLGSPL